MLAMLDHMRQASAIGSPETVRAAVHRFVARTQADEVIVGGATFDPAARRRSLELTQKALS
jgi:alkanesulfonate monooxygenase SsuD/methylene tetrahydromethanopterin reductase-like flavin-dependent oxidoreductase (luciferase family)